jgi:glutamate--cysteine ligase
MSNPGDADNTPLTSVRQMAEYLEAGSKPKDQFRIGTEHEKFGFRSADLTAPPYLPADGQPGCIRDVLANLVRFDGTPILDGENTIGLKQGGASVSLEPAGQLELSGAPVATLHETKQELEDHFGQVREACRDLDVGFAPLGFHPTATRESMPWMPKGRYAIRRRYMPIVGRMGLDMMTRTCTVQVNLDFASEADMRRKLRVSLMLQPLATALFANSPFTEGKPNGFLSKRAHVWTDTDNERAGIPPVMLEDGFGFERYAEWLISAVPMYFVYRDGRYIDVAGESFAGFMAGRVPALNGIAATMGDFADHLTTAFTDVRLKRFLEMRGADAGRPDMMLAQSALWVGLLYDDAALTAAEALVNRIHWSHAAVMRQEVPVKGLATDWSAGWKLRDILPEVVAIASDGLKARGCLNALGDDESAYLDPLREIAAGGPVQAEKWLSRYHGVWGGDVTHIFRDAAI